MMIIESILQRGMTMKKIITYILLGVSLTSAYLASGIPDVKNWLDTARPFFIVSTITLIVALTLIYINDIRRITYPGLVCISSWLYKHKVIKTEFTKNTYLLYKWKNRSYKDLFEYVQNLFDVMYG